MIVVRRSEKADGLVAERVGILRIKAFERVFRIYPGNETSDKIGTKRSRIRKSNCKVSVHRFGGLPKGTPVELSGIKGDERLSFQFVHKVLKFVVQTIDDLKLTLALASGLKRLIWSCEDSMRFETETRETEFIHRSF